MKLKNIEFEEIDGQPFPFLITVEITLEEAVWMSKIAGKQTGNSCHHDIYNCLIPNVFNNYWENGIKDADPGVEIPPLKYE